MKNSIRSTILCSVVILTSIGIVLAQEPNDVSRALSTLMSQARDSKPMLSISDAQLKAANPSQILNLLTVYEKDTDWSVKRMAYHYEMQLARLHPTPEIKQEVTLRLIKELVDPNSSNSRHFYKWLKSFSKDDFNNTSKTLIRQSLSRIKPGSKKTRIVLACGVANVTDQLSRLEEMLIDEVAYSKRTGQKWYRTEGWCARLARARMGIKEDIDKCIELVNSTKHKGLGVLNLLHDIGYIRQPAAINFLKNYVDSDKLLSPVKPTAPGEPVAAYVIDILTVCLVDFPIERREGRGYKQHEIELCRKWMAKQTEWKIRR